MMFYILINVVSVAVAALLGRLLKSFLPKKLIKSIMDVVAVCILIMGIQGSVKTNNFIFMLISLVKSKEISGLYHLFTYFCVRM